MAPEPGRHGRTLGHNRTVKSLVNTNDMKLSRKVSQGRLQGSQRPICCRVATGPQASEERLSRHLTLEQAMIRIKQKIGQAKLCGDRRDVEHQRLHPAK
jgi:hypothetical protein